MSRLPPVVAFAAPSGTGKTTLIVEVTRALVARGLRVAALKSDAHRVVLDTPGKDSWRFSEAGARSVAVLNQERFALFERLEGDVSLIHAIGRLAPDADLVLAEGFRRSGLPTLRVHRVAGPAGAGWTPPANVVAWVSDGAPEVDVPVLPLAEPEVVAEWILARFGQAAPPRRPTVVCPVDPAGDLAATVAAAARLGEALGAPALVVAAPGMAGAPGMSAGPGMAGAPGMSAGPGMSSAAGSVRIVCDLRPQLGLLGALFTGLASADTPEVLLVGARHHQVAPALLTGLLAAGGRADIVYPVIDGHAEPALAVYGHHCLSSIQAALLGGELKLTGWWGQVRACPVDEAVWKGWIAAG